jgi:hypothetical protein
MASDSYKFYTPATPSNDATYDLPATAAGRLLQTPLAQDLCRVGYYLVTIDGNAATVDYYSADVGLGTCVANGDKTIATTPSAMNFTKRESFGYGLNGRQFVIAQGGSYTSIADSYPATNPSTTFAILAGSNTQTSKDAVGRAFSKDITTGWEPRICGIESDIVYLWGMQNAIGADTTETYTVSLSYDPTSVTGAQIASGKFALATQNALGVWVNAVTQNTGGTSAFVDGAWASGATLGSYGVNATNHTVWAVVNYTNAHFAAAITP